MVRYLGPGFTVLYPEVPRWYHGTVHTVQRKAKKSLAGKHPIPKEFWNNGHAGSRLALLYLNCYGQAESRMPIRSYSKILWT